jgi:hypothetical protein
MLGVFELLYWLPEKKWMMVGFHRKLDRKDG